jgi:acylphosphatase
MASYAANAIRGTVSGRVQGVGFRYTTRGLAQELGVAGWVRNLPNGAVEVWAQGPNEAVAGILRFLEQGPPGAAVGSAEFDHVDPDPALEDFTIRY